MENKNDELSNVDEEEARNKLGNDLIDACGYNEDIEKVKDILTKYPDLINFADVCGYSPLMRASYYGKTNIVKLLLQTAGVDVNLTNKYGWSCLMYASSFDHVSVVELLLDVEGININQQNKDGETALSWACYRNHPNVVKMLLAKGALITDYIEKQRKRYNEEINTMLNSWKTYLPQWGRHNNYRYYPKEFNDIMLCWLLVSKKIRPKLPKNIRLLMIEYIADAWKRDMK